MTGPYHVEIRLGQGYLRGAPDLILTFDEMYYADGTGDSRESSEAVNNAYRFNRSPDATLRGTETLAQFYLAALLGPGEEASVMIIGRDRGERAERSGGGVRRDAEGRAFLTLGSKFGERHFRGL